jgi:hypothetical protein
MIADPNQARYEKVGWRIVTTGTWLYDRILPKPISIYAKPARLAWARYDEDDQLDESRPIPNTKDGFLYVCVPGGRREHLTLDDAKAEADAKPWGPVKWD